MKFDFWEMEEHVGKLWDRMINSASSTRYPDAEVQLSDVKKTMGIIFRAMGGDSGLNLETSTSTEHHARKSLLQRIAGNQEKVELSWVDNSALHLPYKLDVFPEKSLNKKLYIWLTAMASCKSRDTGPWLQHNQKLTLDTLKRFPGLRKDYLTLVEAQLAIRPDIKNLPDDEANQEQVILQALKNPHEPLNLKVASRPPQPVYLWMHPSPPYATVSKASDTQPDNNNQTRKQKKDEEQRKRQAQKEEFDSEKKDGLLAIRYENIFSWGEFIKLDRSTDNEDDLDKAAEAAKDMDIIHVTQDEKTIASTLKFDLDLPSAANDDLPMGDGVLLDEWNYKSQAFIKDYCCLQEMISQNVVSRALPARLQKTAKKLKSQFEAITPSRTWYKAQADGNEIDLDAYMQFISERAQGHGDMTGNMYKDLKTSHRDMACLLLADLSLSTDAWVSNESRIIDVIRDSLYLFSESLSSTGDQLAIHGFSSRNRNHVRFNLIKQFSEKYNGEIRGRIDAIKPGYYTRMGAAIRHASNMLEKQKSAQKLLLILTDGKPNDLDIYEGRYGIEDTRMALMEARKKGLQPFCVTIDEKSGDYLPHLFGSGNYILIRKVEELPKQLPLLYARLTQ